MVLPRFRYTTHIQDACAPDYSCVFRFEGLRADTQYVDNSKPGVHLAHLHSKMTWACKLTGLILTGAAAVARTLHHTVSP